MLINLLSDRKPAGWRLRLVGVAGLGLNSAGEQTGKSGKVSVLQS
jgi:hypothetical protein